MRTVAGFSGVILSSLALCLLALATNAAADENLPERIPNELRAYKPVAKCAPCRALVDVVTVDQQEAIRLEKNYEDETKAAAEAKRRYLHDDQSFRMGIYEDRFQAEKSLNSAKASSEHADSYRMQAYLRMLARIKILREDISKLEACNAKCAKALVDPPPPPPPPPPKPPESPVPPKTVKIAPKTITHVETSCVPCRALAEEVNRNAERCSAQNDATSCANVQMYLKHLTECNKQCAAPATVNVNKGATGAPEKPAKNLQQPTKEGVKLPPQPPGQKGLKAVPQQQPAQQGVLHLPPQPGQPAIGSSGQKLPPRNPVELTPPPPQ